MMSPLGWGLGMGLGMGLGLGGLLVQCGPISGEGGLGCGCPLQ